VNVLAWRLCIFRKRGQKVNEKETTKTTRKKASAAAVPKRTYKKRTIFPKKIKRRVKTNY